MKPVVIPIGLDLQGMYDHARILARAYSGMAVLLSDSPQVCTHAYTAKEDMDAETVACAHCGRVVPLWMTEAV